MGWVCCRAAEGLYPQPQADPAALRGPAHHKEGAICRLDLTAGFRRTALVVILFNFYNTSVIIHISFFEENLKFHFQFPAPGLQALLAIFPSFSSLILQSRFPFFVLCER